MLAEYNRLKKEIEKLNKEISQLPDGYLICAKNGKFIKWYVSENKKPVYLPKKNKDYAQKLAIKTNSGNMVRSKSEAFIDMLLHANKIPFRYECALTLGNTTYYPDFTIMHPKTGNLFYWEHFGMMDDPVYAGKAFSKLHNFSKYGIIPSINLITTYETQEHPLDLDTVQKLIEQYFL